MAWTHTWSIDSGLCVCHIYRSERTERFDERDYECYVVLNNRILKLMLKHIFIERCACYHTFLCDFFYYRADSGRQADWFLPGHQGDMGIQAVFLFVNAGVVFMACSTSKLGCRIIIIIVELSL